jgi:hypothetical protein
MYSNIVAHRQSSGFIFLLNYNICEQACLFAAKMVQYIESNDE